MAACSLARKTRHIATTPELNTLSRSPRHHVRDGHERADVGHPVVRFLGGELPLCAPYMHTLAQPRRAHPPVNDKVERVLEARKPHVARETLHRAHHHPRVGLQDAPSRREVRIVDDDVGVRDTALVVIVVDDYYLVVAEVLLGPHGGKPAQAQELDAVPGFSERM